MINMFSLSVFKSSSPKSIIPPPPPPPLSIPIPISESAVAKSPYVRNSKSSCAVFCTFPDCIIEAKPSNPKIESAILFFFVCQFATLITEETNLEDETLCPTFPLLFGSLKSKSKSKSKSGLNFVLSSLISPFSLPSLLSLLLSLRLKA